MLVLYVEDNESYAGWVQSVLKQRGYDVITTANPHSAVTMLEQGVVPDIVIADFVLNDLTMDGVDVLDAVRANPKTHAAQTVLTTGFLDMLENRRDVEHVANADVILPKTGRAADLIELVEMMAQEQHR